MAEEGNGRRNHFRTKQTFCEIITNMKFQRSLCPSKNHDKITKLLTKQALPKYLTKIILKPKSFKSSKTMVLIVRNTSKDLSY